MIDDLIEAQFNKQLQKDLLFQINGKTIKKGKLILFSMRNFYMQFYLKVNKKEHKHYELPYPFEFRHTGNTIYLDYTLNSLTHNNPDLLYKLLGLTRYKQSKIYNSIITVIEEETK